MIDVIIRNFTSRNRHFTIVCDEQGYFQAIEDKYIDEDGKLTKTLYGYQTFANKDMNMTLTNLKNQIEIDYLVEQGHSKAEAFGIVFNLIGKIDMATLEQMFA
jgi:hypothetical protein